MKFFKKFFNAFVATALAATCTFAAACTPSKGGNKNGNDSDPVQLTAPTLTLSGTTLSWNKVTNADAYEIDMNGSFETSVSTTSYNITHVDPGAYVYKIKATSTDLKYTDSEYSNSVTFVRSSTGGTIDPDAELFTVTFDSQGGSAVESLTVYEGSAVIEPAPPVWAGKQFVKWTEDPQGNNEYNFKLPVTKNFTLYAQWADLPAELKEVKSYNESLAVLFVDTIPAEAKVEYKKIGENDWVEIDNELIRLTDDDTICRADIVGLAAGSYNVKITTSSNKPLEIPEAIKVEAYDRSGYAHFNYTDGVGAYKDDGTLKDNAIVIYVTDDNKDTVMTGVCEKYNIPMFNIPTYKEGGTAVGKDWGGKAAAGIGWWLNNSQYTTSNAGSSKNKRPSNTYDKENGGKLGFKNLDRPVVIRFIGTVTSPEGLTSYANEDEGGNVEDNGHMARMKNYKNITIEGIGEDAVIEGWGFHFMAGSDAKNGEGKSFEVRNLTFDKYPEDAIGMEGVQESGRLTGSVERCWIHHNTFLPGYCANPTESDKAEGDGSCDFKRGEYLTVSYNYYNDCHKTNLVGSSDDSLQFNLTYHHNWWHNCGSRIPLTRQANVHFYNNYVSLDTNVPKNINISHVHSIRANSYLFSEANYYFGCKNVADKNSGKAWNNTYLALTGTNNLIDVKDREEAIANNCKHYNGTDLSKFDTDPKLFYYDAENKVSDCLLDDSITARYKVIQSAGCNGWTTNNPYRQNADRSAAFRELIPDQYPAATVQVPDEGKLELSGDSFKSAAPAGIIYQGSASNGNLKGRGQIAIFTLSASAIVTISAPSNSSGNPFFVAENGRVIGQINGTLSVEVPSGTYVITSGTYGHELKDANISSFIFESAEGSAQERIQAAIAAINALPAPSQIQLTDKELIEAAQTAFGALTAKDKENVDATLITKYNDCVTVYDTLCINDVIAKINAIGTVNKDSYDKIQAAQEAFDALKPALRNRVTNYDVLQAAWDSYEGYAVQSVEEKITALVDTSKLDITNRTAIATARAAYDNAKEAYDNLSDGQKDLVNETLKDKLTQGLATLTQLEKLFTFKDQLSAFSGTTVDASNSAAANALKALYTSLTDAQINALTESEKTKYEAIIVSLTEFASQAVKVTFIEGQPSDDIFKHVGGKQGRRGQKVTINQYNEDFGMEAGYQLPSGLKFESTTALEFTLDVKMTLTLYFEDTNTLKISGTNLEAQILAITQVNGDYVSTITLEPGTYKLEKGNGEGHLFYATLYPAG